MDTGFIYVSNCVFTGPSVIQSLSSSASGVSVVHSGNHSTFSTALGWTDKQGKR